MEKDYSKVLFEVAKDLLAEAWGASQYKKYPDYNCNMISAIKEVEDISDVCAMVIKTVIKRPRFNGKLFTDDYALYRFTRVCRDREIIISIAEKVYKGRGETFADVALNYVNTIERNNSIKAREAEGVKERAKKEAKAEYNKTLKEEMKAYRDKVDKRVEEQMAKEIEKEIKKYKYVPSVEKYVAVDPRILQYTEASAQSDITFLAIPKEDVVEDNEIFLSQYYVKELGTTKCSMINHLFDPSKYEGDNIVKEIRIIYPNIEKIEGKYDKFYLGMMRLKWSKVDKRYKGIIYNKCEKGSRQHWAVWSSRHS